MKNLLKDYFSFTSTERKGILVLSFLILFFLLLPNIYSYFKTPEIPDYKAFSEFIKKIEEGKIADSTLTQLPRYFDHSKEKTSFEKPKIELFPFNPNNMSDTLWKKLGLKDWQIKTIRKYESKGGKFKTKADVKKMRPIHDTLYALLEPYITIPEPEKKIIEFKKDSSFKENKFKKDTTYKENKYKKKNLTLELNTTDSITLLEINGIGPWFAFKIINYRKRLGGFISLEQLKEIKGIDSTVFSKIAPHFIVDMFEIKKINLNTATFDELRTHPYLDFSSCKMIISYRIQHGQYKSIEQIKSAAMLNDELYSKLAPYLTIR